jgi:hypothetical protein
MGRLRGLMESVVFAGLKSGARPGQSRQLRWLGPLRGPLERWLGGGSRPDPLYLSARTPTQRLISAARIAVPALFLAGGVVWYIRHSAVPKPPPSYQEGPARSILQYVPDISKIKVESNGLIDVQTARVERGESTSVLGTVKNKSNRTMRLVEIVLDITDSRGQQLGFVTAQVENLGPLAEGNFRISIPQTNASKAIVRDIRAE